MNDGLLWAFSAWMWFTLLAGGLTALTMLGEQRFGLNALSLVGRGSFTLFLFGAGMMLLYMLHGKMIDVFHGRLIDMEQGQSDKGGRHALLSRLAKPSRYEFWVVLLLAVAVITFGPR